MDVARRSRLLRVLVLLIRPPPDFDDYKKLLLSLILYIVSRIPPTLHIRQRLFPDLDNDYRGRNVFKLFSQLGYDFFEVTGETPDSLRRLANEINLPGVASVLSKKNKLLLVIIWLRSYPSYHFILALFNISVSTVKEIIKLTVPILDDHLNDYLQWPVVAEWSRYRGNWPKIPVAVGAIDGTSHKIYRPVINQQQYYSGHRSYHCIHTQIIVDNNGCIRHIETGFLGHQNDAQQFALMTRIGQDLPFPENCVLLAVKIYPNRHPLMTPYTSAQIRRLANRRQARRFNRLVAQYRIAVEHAVAEIKAYKSISSVWRHRRRFLSQTVRVVAKLVTRRKQMGLVY